MRRHIFSLFLLLLFIFFIFLFYKPVISQRVCVCVCVVTVQWTLILCIYMCLLVEFIASLSPCLILSSFCLFSLSISICAIRVFSLVVGSVGLSFVRSIFRATCGISAYSHLHKYMYLCTKSILVLYVLHALAQFYCHAYFDSWLFSVINAAFSLALHATRAMSKRVWDRERVESQTPIPSYASSYYSFCKSFDIFGFRIMCINISRMIYMVDTFRVTATDRDSKLNIR